MKKKSLFFRLVVLVAAMTSALCVNAQEPYACYTSENTTLTFYYDNLRSSRSGTIYDLNDGGLDPVWVTDFTNANVTQVVFNPSFASARPTVTKQWFYEMKKLESITGLVYLNTSKVTRMDAMFYHCYKLTSLDLSSFNTSKVTDMSEMFRGCSTLQTIYVGDDWKMSDMALSSSKNVFKDCNKLVGGKGTAYDANHVDADYAHIDGGTDNPGYLTEPEESDESIPEGMARVTLTVGSVWSDGTGYQMLLDADATAYGTVFSSGDPLTLSGDADASVYEAFEYKIPKNADGACNTANVVLNNSISILIPAGVYDWCITNPTPGDRVWIASRNGNIGGRQDNYRFRAGKAYTFTVSRSEQYSGKDATDVVVTGSGYPPAVPTNVSVEPDTTIADVEWTGDDDSKWDLRYRVYKPDTDPEAQVYFWDFEDGMDDWTSIDADDDGYGWYLNDPLEEGYDPGDGICLFGTKSATSASYIYDALYPDNWLVSPKVILDGQLSFWAAGQDPDCPEEVFAVYATTGDPNDLDGYVKISEDITATSPIREYTFDLNNFAGQEGYVAFRHYNVSDMFRLNIDNVSIRSQRAPAPWVNIKGLTKPSYTIENLTPNTKYEVQVIAYNEDYPSDWSEIIDFTTLRVFELGDVNHDGKVNITDVTALVNYLLGNGNIYVENADTNRDQTINIADVTRLVYYLLNDKWPDMVYTVAGTESVFGSNWDPTDERNNMVKGENGIYTWTKSGVTLRDDFEFKVVGDHNYSIYEWPIGEHNNYVVNVAEEGIYTIVITFNPEADEAERITYTLTRTGDVEHVYTVAGTYKLFEADWDPNCEQNNMVKGSDGIYRLQKTGYFTEGTEIKFKIVQDHSWDHAWPAEDWLIYVPETGAWDYVIKFMPYNNDEDKIAVEITKVF